MPPELPKSVESNDTPAFVADVDRLSATVGEPVQPIPEGVTEQDLLDEQVEAVEDNKIETINELLRQNEVIYRLAALQREADFNDKKPTEFGIDELVVANRVATYYEYLLSTINHTKGVLEQYKALREQFPDVSPELEAQEKYLEQYVQELERILAERIAYANVLLLDAAIAKNPTNKADLEKLREQYLRKVSEKTRQALQGNQTEKFTRGNELNQEIVSLLAGTTKLEGGPENFLPQQLYFQLLRERYKDLVAKEKEIAADPNRVKAKAEFDRLVLKQEMAKQGTGEVTADDVKRFEYLKKVLDDGNQVLDELRKERQLVIGQMISIAQKLGEFQINQTEITTIQNQFGNKVDYTGASEPREDTTPSFIREALGDTLEDAEGFHAERMTTMLTVMEEDVLTVGLGEQTEDFWNKNGRETVRQIAEKLSKIVTLPIPETGGLKDMAEEQLVGPLREALGWPPGKDKWEDLTPEEQERVQEKAKSIADAVNEFDKETITRSKETIAVVQSMPAAETYVGEEVKEPLPTERVTMENRDELIEKYGGATVYFMLFEQMDQDMNAFMGEYGTFLNSVNKNIDNHIDVGKALKEMSNTWFGMSKGLLIAALVILGAGVLTGALAARYLSKAVGGTARLGVSMVRGTFRQLGRLRNVRLPAYLTRARYLAQERQLVRAIEGTRVGRMLGRLAFLRNSRFARGTGGTLRVAGALVIPAITAYDMYLTQERKNLVEGNDELVGEYSSQQRTALLEGAGLTATLAVGLGPAIVLGAPVMYAGHVARQRSESRANWQRSIEDWQKEFSSAQLKQKLLDVAPGTELENQGGAYPTRVGSWFYTQEEYDEIFETIKSGNQGARGKIYTAYFAENLIVPEGTTEEQAAELVKRKYMYINKFTHGGMERVTAEVLQQADAYAYLMQMYKEKEKAGEPLLLSYFDDKGERQWVDLEKLTGTRQEMIGVVADYFYRIKPQEELILFNTLGEMAKEGRLPLFQERQRKKSAEQVRQTILIDLLHDIHEAERGIVATDWPGLELTGYEGSAENLVRWYLRFRLDKKINQAVPQLLDGQMTVEDYEECKRSLRSILQEPIGLASGQGSSTDFRDKAKEYLSDIVGGGEKGEKNVDNAEGYQGNGLYEILQ